MLQGESVHQDNQFIRKALLPWTVTLKMAGFYPNQILFYREKNCSLRFCNIGQAIWSNGLFFAMSMYTAFYVQYISGKNSCEI